MIVMFKSTPLPPTRFVFLIIYSYLTHRPSVDMVPPVLLPILLPISVQILIHYVKSVKSDSMIG